MIDEAKTLEKYGYTTKELAPTSNLPVWWTCDKDDCGTEREYSYAYCLRKQKKAAETGGQELCQKCSHAHRKGKVSNKKIQGKSYVELPPEVDVNATLERFGHDPHKLSPWSRQRIVVRCQKTGEVCTPRRCSLNRYKSILETGHFVSVGGWTAERRKGVKASSDTKTLMKDSQQKRRVREKKPVAPTQNPSIAPETPSIYRPKA